MSEEPKDDDDRKARRWPLENFLGDRYPRTWEWRDSLGCVWFVALAVVLTLATLLSQLGVPSRVIQVGTIATVIVLLVGLWLIARSGRGED